MKILIVDDDKRDIESLRLLLNDFFKKYNMNHEISIMYTIKDINLLCSGYDIIFLDIEIKDINGIMIAQEIRKVNKHTKIIFVSNYDKYSLEGYKVRADRYFLKPIVASEFNAEMKDILQCYILDHLYIYDTKICNQRIFYRDILYIEIIQRHSYIHVLNGKPIITPYTLKYWEGKLCDAYFGQPHKSFFINLQNVSSFNSNEIKFINDEKIPLSRTFKNSFIKEYQLYLDILV